MPTRYFYFSSTLLPIFSLMNEFVFISRNLFTRYYINQMKYFVTAFASVVVNSLLYLCLSYTRLHLINVLIKKQVMQRKWNRKKKKNAHLSEMMDISPFLSSSTFHILSSHIFEIANEKKTVNKYLLISNDSRQDREK